MFTRVFLQHLMDEPIFVGISQGQGLYYYPFIFSHTNILFIKYSYFSNAQWPISHPKVQTQTAVLCWIWSQIQWNDYATVSTTYIVPRRKMKGISRKEKIYYWVWKENNILKIRNERTCWCVCVYVCVCVRACSVPQSGPILCDPMDYSLPGSSVSGPSWATILHTTIVKHSYIFSTENKTHGK